LRGGSISPVDRALGWFFLETGAAGLQIGATQPRDVGFIGGFPCGGPYSEADFLTWANGQSIGIAGERGFIRNRVYFLNRRPRRIVRKIEFGAVCRRRC
jgi:hypothetical protein